MKRIRIVFCLLGFIVFGIYMSNGQIVINGETTICSGNSATLSVGTGTVGPGSCSSSVYMSDGTTNVSCGSTVCFYDSGGPNSTYYSSESYVRTFVSSNNSPISITFNMVDVEESYDEIYLYDGGTLLNNGNYYSGLSGMTFTATSGSLTVEFISDGSVTYDGWDAVVYCGAASPGLSGNCVSSLNMSSGTTTVNCGNNICFYDSGGSSGSYGSSESYLRTFTSSNNSPVVITFSTVNVEESFDEIYLYDGPNTSGTPLNSGNYYSGLSGMTFTANSGSLTVYFTSDGSVMYSGWSAVVGCEGPNEDYSYHWSTGSSDSEITVSPTSTTTYSVTVTLPDNTTETASLTVNVVDCGNSGCPSVSPAELGTNNTNIVIDCDVTTVTLCANAVATATTANDYTVMSIPYNPPFSFTAGTRIFTDATDDTWGQPVNLPFAFCYYGNTYTQIVPGANAVASFNTDQAGGYCTWSYSASLPSTSLFPNTIFACYRDIYPNYYTGDGIYEGVLGAYPCRSYVLSFNNIALFSCYSVRTFSSQIVLYEGTNIIDVYLRDAPTCTGWNSGNGVVGIQNSSGTAAVVPPGRNTGPWTAHNEAWRFIPTGEPVYTITWYQGSDITGPVVGTGDVITVTPPGTTDYTARLQYTACNGNTFDIVNTCHVTMNNDAPPVTVTASPEQLCANMPTTLTVSAPEAISYEWSTGATTAVTTAYPTTDPTTYTVTVGYQNGCTSLGSVTVHIDLIPPVYSGSIGPVDANVNNCIFMVPDLVAQIRPYCTDNYTATSDLTITQSPAAGSIITGETVVTITITDECGNSTTTTVTVTVPELPNLSLVEQRDILCYGMSTGYLSVEGGSGTPPYSFSWTTGNVSNPANGSSNSEITSLQADSYTVVLTDAEGCSATGTYTIQYLSQPMVAGTLSESQVICSGSVPQPLTVSGASGGVDSYYVWQQSTDGVTFTNVEGAGSGSSYSVGDLEQDMCYRVAYTSDSCGVVYTNIICITIGEHSHVEVEQVICYGLPYQGFGFSIPASALTTPGLHTDSLSLQTAEGCDSVIVLNLTVQPPITATEEQTIVENQLPYTWNGIVFTSEGTQTTVLTAADGCDSTLTMILHVIPNIVVNIDTTVCSSELPLTWHGHTFVSAGTYSEVYTAALGCDSTVNMTVYVIMEQFVTVTDAVCQNEAYSGYGFSVPATETTVPGVVEMSETLTASTGCDSTVTLALTVNSIYENQFDVVACDSYEWHGQSYQQSGTYSVTLTSSAGCDSVEVLNLTVNQSVTGTDEQTIVENQLPYTWNGVVFTSEGTQTTVLTAANGCDSTLTMTLHVIPNVYTNIDTTVCANALPLQWNGVTFTEEGTQSVVYTAALGSDSTVTMTVNVIPAQFVTVTGEVCQNEPYSGYGFEVTAEQTAEAGMVEVSQLYATALGCDSTVTLQLTVNPNFTHHFDVVVCDSMVWNGQVYKESGTYTQSFSSSHGCDSVVTKDVEVVSTDLVLENLTPDFCMDYEAVLEVTTGLEHIQWSTGEEDVSSIVVHRAGTYVVNAYTAQCHAFSRIIIPPCMFYLYLPNAITPSLDDGNNDYFSLPEGVAYQIETFEIHIFDRWGRVVYKSTNPYFKWDGREKGKLRVTNTYTYAIKLSVYGGGNYMYKGVITVL